MSSVSPAFALASFGIALGNSLPSDSLKKVKRSTSFALYSASQTLAKLDFSPIDSLPDFGLTNGTSRDLLGSFIFQVLSLSEFNWKWAIQARLSLFEPSFAGTEESLSAQLHRIGHDLDLSADILDALPFSSRPPQSVFLPSSGADDIDIPFFAGIIMLWALRCRLPKVEVSSLLPPHSISSSSFGTASESISPIIGSSLTSGSLHTPEPSQSAPPASSAPPSDSPAVLLLLSQLTTEVRSLASAVATVQASQHPASLSPQSSSWGPLGNSFSYPAVLSAPSGLSSFEPIDLSSSSESTSSSPSVPVPGFPAVPVPGVRSSGSLSVEAANAIIVADCSSTSRLTMQQLTDGLATGALLSTPTGGHVRVFRLARSTGSIFSVVNAAHDHHGPGPLTLSSAPRHLWPQSRAELILLQQEHSHMLAADLRRRQSETADPLVLNAILHANVLATQATHQFHQRAAELAEHVYAGLSPTVHVTTWAWIWFFLYKRWNLAWASGDLSAFTISFVPEFQTTLAFHLNTPPDASRTKTALLLLCFFCETCQQTAAHTRFCFACKVGYPASPPLHSRAFATWAAQTKDSDKSEAAFLRSAEYTRLKATHKGQTPKDPEAWFKYLSAHQNIIPVSRGLSFD